MPVEITELSELAPEPACSFSFKDLTEALLARQDIPSLPEISDLIARTTVAPNELLPYVGFKAGNYCRHRVMRNEFVEMLVLCWKPGQRTPIHDHNGSHGVVVVHAGIMWETTFDYDAENGLGYKAHRELRAGGLTGSELPDIHQIGNPDVSGQDLITIHIYAPPLGVLKTYKLGSSTIDLYTPADPDFFVKRGTGVPPVDHAPKLRVPHKLPYHVLAPLGVKCL